MGGDSIGSTLGLLLILRFERQRFRRFSSSIGTTIATILRSSGGTAILDCFLLVKKRILLLFVAIHAAVATAAAG